MALEVSELTTRDHFGKLLNRRGLCGIAVEIGTHRGEFASQFMDRWSGSLLYCVDPWEQGYDPGDPASYGDRAEDHREAMNALHRHALRVRVIKNTSELASRQFHDDSIDFCYIDGNHQPDYVRTDFRVWWPKIRPGGIFAGHDFICPGERSGGWGQYIQPIVLDFAKAHDLTVWLVVEQPKALPWSYYMFKPE